MKPVLTSLQQEAKDHIERIRTEYSLAGHKNLAELIRNSLEILSTELYDTSTHFVLELLQNADDNEYTCANPTLTFTYKPGTLRVDCNEVGFRPNNVDAICTIRKSTKSSRDASYGYTGEKGIGFKSIFRVADVVWISSCGYSFKFDRHEPFGLVAPTWEDFPEPVLPDTTSFLLQLSKGHDAEEIVHALRTLDPALLLFLRRIKTINLQITTDSIGSWRREIRCRTVSEDGDLSLTSLEYEDQVHHYLISSHGVASLPDEHRRQNCATSKIFLAFPVIESGAEPYLLSQVVYAGLPIGNHGFKFLVNGDFLLTANRSQIDTSLLWNAAIRDAVGEAFVMAVDSLVKGPIEYLWPIFVPSVLTSEFFRPCHDHILQTLETSAVLEALDGTMADPSSLTYVDPDRFADIVGHPFTLSKSNASRFLSPHYPQWTIDSICSLGVRRLSDEDFLTDLKSLIAEDPDDFHGRSSQWHAQLSKALLRLSTNSWHFSTLKTLEVIPLSNGTWTSANTGPVLFSGDIGLLGTQSKPKPSKPTNKQAELPSVKKSLPTPTVNRTALHSAYESYELFPQSLDRNLYPAAESTNKEHLFNSIPSYRSPPSQTVAFNAIASPWRDLALARDALYSPSPFDYSPSPFRNYSPPTLATRHTTTFFTSNSSLLSASTNNALTFVDPHASKDDDRRAFFERLGIKSVGTPEMCQFIVDIHNHYSFSPDHWDREQLISHVKFLHQSSWAPSKKCDIWYVTADEKRCKGSELYVIRDLMEGSSTAGVFENLPGKLPIIHADYFQGESNDSGLIDYLITNFQLARVPRLVSSKSSPYALSTDFKLILLECKTSHVLQMLSDNWHHYSEMIQPDASRKESVEAGAYRELLLRDIRNAMVETRTGPSSLGKTCLPMIDPLIDEAELLPILDIETPKDNLLQQRLSLFHVQVGKSAPYYFDSLTALRSRSTPDPELIRHIYEQLQMVYEDDEHLVELFFKEDAFIFASENGVGKSSRSWYHVEDCVLGHIDVASQYPSSERLFRSVLAVDGLKFDTLVSKTTSINLNSRLEDIVSLLADISSSMSTMSEAKATVCAKRLKRTAMFPVIKGKGKASFDHLSSADDDDWFVADRDHLQASFENRVTLLALTTSSLNTITELLKALHLEGRRLSATVATQEVPRGTLKTWAAKEDFFNARARFIKALVPKSDPRAVSICRQLDWIQLGIASEIVQTYKFVYKTLECQGRTGQGQTAAVLTGQSLRLFVTRRSDSDQNPFPELVGKIAKLCGIEDRTGLVLLYAMLYERNTRSIQAMFAQHGIHVDLLDVDSDEEDTNRAPRKYKAPSTKLESVPLEEYSDRELSSADEFSDAPSTSDSDDSVKDLRWKEQYKNRKPRPARVRKRRLPLMSVKVHSSEKDVEQSHGKKEEIAQDLDFIGQTLLSMLFEKHLEAAYQPNRHWTSPLRSKAGFTAYLAKKDRMPFTISGPKESQRVTDFLAKNNCADIGLWRENYPTYHFDVAVSEGGEDDCFFWNSSQLEKARKNSLPDGGVEKVRDVTVLARITHVFSNPQFRFLVDPWRLVASGEITLKQDLLLEALLSRQATHGYVPSTALSSKPSRKRQEYTYYDGKSGPLQPWASVPAYAPPQYHAAPTYPAWEQQWAWSSTEHPQQYMIPAPGYDTFQQPHESTYMGMNRFAPQQYSSGPFNSQIYPQWPTNTQTTSFRSQQHLPTSESAQDTSAIKTRLQAGKAFNSVMSGLPYQYQRLGGEQIRLLLLFPGVAHEPLHGLICTLDLRTAKKYKTLSYVWGGDLQSKYELKTPRGVIRLNASLHSALRRLRRKDGPLLLWADAICINQTDLREKEQQIALMPRIYQRASYTLAFLGAEEEDNAAMVALLQMRAWKLFKAGPWKWPKDLPQPPTSWGKAGMPSPDALIWNRIDQLFGRALFRRAWIIQEMIASPVVRVVCGNYAADWNDLAAAVQLAEVERQITSPSWQPFLTLAKLRSWESKKHRWTIFRLLETFRHVKSTLKRDRFYALLSIASDGDLDDFEPDYSSTFEDVVLRFAKAFVKRARKNNTSNGAIAMLHRAGLGSLPDRFASWIPDWTVERAVSLYNAPNRGTSFDACGELDEDISCTGTDELSTVAVVVDRINAVSRATNTPNEHEKYFEEVDAMVGGLGDKYNSIQKDEFKLSTPIAGAERPDMSAFGDTDLAESYRIFREGIIKATPQQKKSKSNKKRRGHHHVDEPAPASTMESSSSSAPAYGEEMTQLDNSSDYAALLSGPVEGWRFITTEERKACGVAPGGVQVGDLVAVFGGGEVPFVVRQSESRAGKYRLVGECYVEGIMDGEAVEGETGAPLCLH